ncbi:MAG TPA: HAMP domain-containing sensor histidine kinase [Cerasibacillus sp.]|uniref:sensor histidine kinase n=1 Tax=Cerasibacillus sp. TaxID=2498711 RepID=UPI002F426115
MKKIRRSLLLKYIFLFLFAIGFIQIVVMLYMLTINVDRLFKEQPTSVDIEERWAKDMKHASPETLENVVTQWHHEYPSASFFYVDGGGMLKKQWYRKDGDDLPKQWDAMRTTKFIKSRYDSDPFTVIQFIGDDLDNGFAVLEIDRAIFETNKLDDRFIIIAIVLFIVFIFVSILFFLRILKRLVQLENAMTVREVDGLPIKIEVKKKDEIGAVELAFNQMVDELREAKKQERREEQLRRELIANLSHDLKTPLTKMRAQLRHFDKKETKEIDASIDQMSALIENLMAYTLLTADKMLYKPEDVRIDRLVNRIVASWYPAFEQAGFYVELKTTQAMWTVDAIWFERIIDNLLQNVLRHADKGKYVGIRVSVDAVIIQDNGEGIQTNAQTKGAGIGLSIVRLMADKMDLQVEIASSKEGTTVRIGK